MRFAYLAVACLAVAGISSVSCQDTLWMFNENAPEGTTVDEFKGLLTADIAGSGLVDLFNTTGQNGTIFVPTDAAIISFLDAAKLTAAEFTGNTAFVQALISDHAILPTDNDMAVMGTGESKLYLSAAGNNVSVTFNDNGNITMVRPDNLAPSTYGQMSNILGSYGPITPDNANATIYFVDAVIVTKETYDTYIGKGARTYYQAIEKVIAEMDGELSTFKAVVDLFPDVKDLLELDFPEMNNQTTLFAPTNDAFEKLLTALGAGTSLADLVATEGLKELVSTILKYHYVPDQYASEMPHTSFSDGDTVNTTLSAGENPPIPGATLTLGIDGDVYTVSYGLTAEAMMMTNISSSMLNVKHITRTGFSLDEDESHEGHLHIVSDVLLPITNTTLFNLAAFNDEANRPSDNAYSTFGALVDAAVPELAFAKLALNGPALRGAMFIPSNASIDTFFADNLLNAGRLLRNADLARAVIYEHTIFDTVMDGTNKTYQTWGVTNGTTTVVASKDITVSVDSTNDYVMSFTASNATANVEGWYGQNANGLVADAISGGKRNGYVYYIDRVIVSSAVTDAVAARASPANGAWATQGPAGRTFDTALEVLNEVPSLRDLMNDEDAQFSIFMPNDQAFETLAVDLNVTVTALKETLLGNEDLLLEMLSSYIVMADKYNTGDTQNPPDCTDDECEMELDRWYETRAGTWLQVTADGFSVSDTNPTKKRNLLATSGNKDSCAAFFDGKTICYVDTAVLTDAIREAAVAALNSASSVAPSMGLLVALMALFL